jgi:hypothetical protein
VEGQVHVLLSRRIQIPWPILLLSTCWIAFANEDFVERFQAALTKVDALILRRVGENNLRRTAGLGMAGGPSKNVYFIPASFYTGVCFEK